MDGLLGQGRGQAGLAGRPELRLHAQLRVTVPSMGASSKQPAYYKLDKLQVGWIFMIFIDFHVWGAEVTYRGFWEQPRRRVKWSIPVATSKHPGGYISTNTAYYKLNKLQVGWIFVIFVDFRRFSLIFMAGGLRLHAPAFGNSSGGG